MNKLIKPILFLIIIGFSCTHRPCKRGDTSSTKDSIEMPQLFANGIISSDEYDSHPAFSPSGDTLFFIRCSADINTCSSIYVSYKIKQKWTIPVIAPFSGKYYDADPFVTKDGKVIYFVSNRPLKENGSSRTDWDIWKVELTAGVWSKPIHLDAPVNSNADEYYPTVADTGNMYFGSAREGGNGGSDIYFCKVSEKGFSTPENIGDSINTANNEYEPFIAPDESYLIFMATIPKGLKNADLFVSYKQQNKWSKPEKLNYPVSVNSVTEWSPKVTRDKTYFFFGSTRARPDSVMSEKKGMKKTNIETKPGNGFGDIYYVDFKALKLKVTK